MVSINFLLILFGLTVLIGLTYSTMSLIGASIYDMRLIRRQSMRRKHPHRRAYRKRPLVTVLVPAHNEEVVIKRCLDSLLASTYRKFEIVVIDDASIDNTRQIVMQYICAHPSRNISLLNMHVNRGKAGALNHALKRQARGDIIMTLDSDCTIDRYAISRAVRHFIEDEPSALSPNVRIMDNGKILGTLQQFEFLGGFRSKKFNNISNSEYIVGGAGAMYTRDAMNKLGGYDESMKTEDIALSLALASLGNKENRIHYASDVLVYTEPVSTYKSLLKQRYRWKFGGLQAIYQNRQMLFNSHRKYSKMLSWVRLPMAVWAEFQLLLEPIYFTYFIYLALKYHNPILFIIAWATMTGFLLLALWGDEHMTLIRKIRMTLLAPLMYIVFYVMTSIQVIAAFRCLFNFKFIANRKLVRGTWISPERIGQTV
ncbi:MAG TPA: glycosyltransferase [Candidatus Saccharimonadales bacterium]|nr:glycosyltransferase [Candidatus Saccharimonadales bacterium]